MVSLYGNNSISLAIDQFLLKSRNREQFLLTFMNNMQSYLLVQLFVSLHAKSVRAPKVSRRAQMCLVNCCI